MDVNKLTTDMFNNIIAGINALRDTLPATEEVTKYITDWTRIIAEGRDSEMSNEQKVQILNDMASTTAISLAFCIQRNCEKGDQHAFMSNLVVIINTCAKEASQSILEDLMGNDDFMKAVFGSGIN